MEKNTEQIGKILPYNSTIKLDQKNVKILSLLMENARVPFSHLSKQVQLSKSNVIRRVQSMQDSGLLTGYHAFIDLSKVGVNASLLFLKTSFTEKDKEKFLQEVVHYKEIYSAIEVTGVYDIVIALYYKKGDEKNHILEKILKEDKIRDFETVNITTYFPKLDYTKDLFEKKSPSIINNKHIGKLDKLDIEILQNLSQNCRINLVDLAEKLKSNRETISYRMKRLINDGEIAKFQPTVNLFLLGFESYFLTLKLKRPSNKDQIIEYLSSSLRCNTILESDSCEIMCFIHFKSNKEFREFEENMLRKFSDSILEYNFEIFKKQYKLDWLPKDFSKTLY